MMPSKMMAPSLSSEGYSSDNFTVSQPSTSIHSGISSTWWVDGYHDSHVNFSYTMAIMDYKFHCYGQVPSLLSWKNDVRSVYFNGYLKSRITVFVLKLKLTHKL